MRTHYIKLSFLIMICLVSLSMTAQVFAPWGLYKESDYARMREKVALKEEPYWTAWLNLLGSPEASLNYYEGYAQVEVSRPGNFATLYKDAAAVNQLALIYKINGNKEYGDKVVRILNNWSSKHVAITGNAERYLAAGYGYMFANAAIMMKDHPNFEVERFQKYLERVFYKPMTERFLIGNEHGAPHNDACCSNYRANWNTPNMAAMAAIAIFCERQDWYQKGIDYFKNGCSCGRGHRPTGQIDQAIPHFHTLADGTELAQWEESGRDQGHTIVGFSNMANFLEIMYNQGDDLYAYKNEAIRKAAEYIARYNAINSSGNFIYTLESTPYTVYCRGLGQACSNHCEFVLDSERYNRGSKGAPYLSVVYNHYAHRAEVPAAKVRFMKEAMKGSLWGANTGPSAGGHPDAYDNLGFTALTHTLDSGSCVLPWLNMDIYPTTISKQPQYGKTKYNSDKSSLLVEGSGSGIRGTTDAFQFAFQRMIDNGTLTSIINMQGDSNPSTQAGLMLREKLTQNAANVFFGLSASEGIVFTKRSKAGGSTTVIATKNDFTDSSCRLKLERDDNTVKAFIFKDDESWELVGSTEIDFDRAVFVGMATSSQNPTLISEVQFEATELLRGNAKPFVKISSPTGNLSKYIAPAMVTVSGMATDIDGNIAKVEVLVDNEVIATDTKATNINTLSHSIKGLDVGEHTITLRAYDDAGNVSVSEPIIISVKETEFQTNKGIQHESILFSFDNYANAPSTTSVYDADTIFGRATLLNGATFTESGKYGSAVNLNGNGAYIKLPNNFVHKLSEFTIAFWAKMTQKNSNHNCCRIFDFGSGTQSYMFFTPYVGVGSDNMRFSIKGDGSEASLAVNSSFPLNSWTHITITIKNDVLSIYRNGTEIAKSANFNKRPYDIDATTIHNFIGKSQYESDGYFPGSVDEFRIINRGVTKDEVREIMLNTFEHTATDAVYYNNPVFYPNPAESTITIQDMSESELKIFDSMGRMVHYQKITSQEETIHINTLTSGLYILQIKDAYNRQYRNRLIKK